MKSKTLALWMAVTGVPYSALLLLSGAPPLFMLPLLGLSLALLPIGLLPKVSRTRRYLVPLSLLAYSCVLLGTLFILHLSRASLIAKSLGVALLLLAALATMRAIYVWAPRRKTGLHYYYDS
jgi:hypothetical protein